MPTTSRSLATAPVVDGELGHELRSFQSGTRTLLSRDNLRRAYHTAVARVADPVATLGYTPRRVLLALRDCGPDQTAETLRGHLRGRLPTTRTIGAALCELEAAGLVVRHAVGDGEPSRWSAANPPRHDPFAGLKLRGPHDLRHTFSTWLEDAGIPARVIDELMGHAGGRPGGGEQDGRGSVIGLRYRWTTQEMEARVVAAIEQRLAVSLGVAAQVSR
jgi:Phage integrase family